MKHWQAIAQRIENGQNCILLTITDVKGSAPREIGASMIVTDTGEQTGTIGGGTLEWQATRQAQSLLAKNESYLCQEQELILGPDLEQCCGGVVRLSFELFTKAEKAQVRAKAQQSALTEKKKTLLLFGAGHVGKAMVRALADHDFAIRWIDTREKMFPAHIPDNTQTCQTAQPEKLLTDLPQDTFVLIMTHSHDQDFKIAITALQNRDISFVGLIGSGTKKARFVKRFADGGLTLDQISRLTCPIGITGISSKTPQAIATSVVAQLLIETELVKTVRNNVCFQKNSA